MGINIGDLSSIALCSVPPKPSNYLQRVGRAGRVNGNSFVLTVANARPHDLYFYFEPEEMIQGRVETPGCFLNASAVLERQFTAYVFDRWVETGVPEGALPDELRAVLDAVESGDRAKGFPANLLAFFEQNRTALEDGFLALFEEEVADYTRERIRAFSRGTDLDIAGLERSIWEGIGRGSGGAEDAAQPHPVAHQEDPRHETGSGARPELRGDAPAVAARKVGDERDRPVHQRTPGPELLHRRGAVAQLCFPGGRRRAALGHLPAEPEGGRRRAKVQDADLRV